MKKALVICMILLLVFGCCVLVACSGKDGVTITSDAKTGAIGAFSALTPTDGITLNTIPSFSWTEASNADTYTLEIASTDEFAVTDEYYIVKSGITATNYNLSADLKKDKTYYWRVTALNGDSSAVISGSKLSFRYEATLANEIRISLGYADEWKVHEVGSKATVTLDHSSFFADKSNATEVAEKKDSLRVSFDSEDTQRGDKYVESNGWVVVTRSLESEFYGVDAFYFNFYYAGNDASAYFRVIDEDNEYWYAPIKLASNAKQTIILPLSSFVLRTKGTPVANKIFDYQYLKSMELVFERVDGDGVAYLGDLRAIRYANYQDMFVDDFDFRRFAAKGEDPTGALVNDSAYFTYTNSVNEAGDALTISFTKNDSVDSSLKGFGFVKMPVGKILATSDAFSFHVDLSGVTVNNYNFLLRVIEEDDDVWMFKIAASDIPGDGNMLVPFSAFLLSEFKGDGIRQFYYVKQLHFGMNGLYYGGNIVVDHLAVVSLADKVKDLYTTTVSEDGVIEDFESYTNAVNVYYKWEPSSVNKDEAIEHYKYTVFGTNNHTAKFYYKTDLPEAEYKINFTPVKGYTAIEIEAKDVPVGTKNASMTVYLYGGPNSLYYYTIRTMEKNWTSYVIPLASFSLAEGSFGSRRISCENITGISIAFKSTFVKSLKAQYASGSYACVDNIRFTNATAYSATEIPVKIKRSSEDSRIAVISDFEADTAETLQWSTNDTADYATLTIKSGETNKYLELGYKTLTDTVYYIDMDVDSLVSANGLTFEMSGGSYSPTIVVVLYGEYGGNKYKFQKEISRIGSGWTTYELGFNNFIKTEGDSSFTGWTASFAQYITKIAISIKKYNVESATSSVSIDNIRFSRIITMDTLVPEVETIKMNAGNTKAVISDFEGDDSVVWDVKANAVEASSLATNAAAVINDEESASGEGKSLQLSYKSKMVAPFYADVFVDEGVAAKGLTLLLKGDNKSPYIEIIIYVNSTPYIATINVVEGWNYYTIGFSQFHLKSDGETSLTDDKVTKINQIALFIKNNNGNYIASSLFLDEIYFDNTTTISTNSATPYEA